MEIINEKLRIELEEATKEFKNIIDEKDLIIQKQQREIEKLKQINKDLKELNKKHISEVNRLRFEQIRLMEENEQLKKNEREYNLTHQYLGKELRKLKLRCWNMENDKVEKDLKIMEQLKVIQCYESIIDNLTAMLTEIPHNNPIRKEIVNKISKNIDKNEEEKKFFIENVLIKSGFQPRYLERVKNVKIKYLSQKYTVGVKRNVWGKDTLDSFEEVMDIIMPYRSGRNFRIRRKNFGDTYDDYARNMGRLFPRVKFFSYRVFWEHVRKSGDRIRRFKTCTWCPLCEKINEGERILNDYLEQTNDGQNLDYDFYTTKWMEEFIELQENHWAHILNQYEYYKNDKQRIFNDRDENSFVLVQDFSKLDIQKGNSWQDQIITVYYYDPNHPTVLQHRYVNYIASAKNDKWFVFSSWYHLLKKHELFRDKSNFNIVIFSDGAAKHYKQRYQLNWFAYLKENLGINVEYNFFVSYHGFNPCDSAGSHVKRAMERWITMDNQKFIPNDEAAVEIINSVRNHYGVALNIYREANSPDISGLDQILKYRQVTYTQNQNNIVLRAYRTSTIRSVFNSSDGLIFTLNLVQRTNERAVRDNNLDEFERIYEKLEEHFGDRMDLRDNDEGALGFYDDDDGHDGEFLTPIKIPFFKDKRIIQIACGWGHSFFLCADNKIYATGSNNRGQLGIGEFTLFGVLGKNQPNPVFVSSMKNEKIISIKCGGDHSIFLTEKKQFLVGRNKSGQLGNGNFEDVSSLVLFEIGKKKIIQTIFLCGSSIYFTKDEVWGCGSNNYGELFNGKKKDKNPKIMKICDLKVKMNTNHISLLIKLNDMKERFDFVSTSKMPFSFLYL